MGMAFCPACGNGIEVASSAASPRAGTCWLKEAGTLFTEQNVRDAYLAWGIGSKFGKGDGSLHYAVGEWIMSQGLEGRDLNASVNAARQRHGRTDAVARVAELVFDDNGGRGRVTPDLLADSPVVTVKKGLKSVRAWLRPRALPFEGLADLYGFPATLLLALVHDGVMEADKIDGEILLTARDVEECICAGSLGPLPNCRFTGQVRGVSYRITARPWSANLRLLVNSASEVNSLTKAWVYTDTQWTSLGADVSRFVFTNQTEKVQERVDKWASSLVADARAKGHLPPQQRVRGTFETEEERFYRLLDSAPWEYMDKDWMD